MEKLVNIVSGDKSNFIITLDTALSCINYNYSLCCMIYDMEELKKDYQKLSSFIEKVNNSEDSIITITREDDFYCEILNGLNEKTNIAIELC